MSDVIMSSVILMGRGREIIKTSRSEWEVQLSKAPERSAGRLSFMSEAHHRVRNFVVTQLPRAGGPLRMDSIAQELSISTGEVQVILDELESNLFFLVRNEKGEVTWGYPVTVDETPHRLSFTTGEQAYAA